MTRHPALVTHRGRRTSRTPATLELADDGARYVEAVRGANRLRAKWFMRLNIAQLLGPGVVFGSGNRPQERERGSPVGWFGR